MLLFEVGSPVTDIEFINRKEELKQLMYYIENQQNVMIKAPRRFGKTSLIKQSLLISKPNAIYIDLKRAPALSYITEQLLNEMYKIVGVNNFFQQFKESIAKFINTVKSSVSINIFEILRVTLEKIETEKNVEELFLYSLDTLEKLAHENSSNIVIILDEFQDIVKLGSDKILDKMRAVVQHHKMITYIFAGSHETLMAKIFHSKSSPFFYFCRTMSIDGLNINDLSNHILEKLKLENIVVDFADLKQIFLTIDGHPYYSMKFMQILHYYCSVNDIKNIDTKVLNYALDKAIFETESYLQDIITKLKSKKYHYEVLYSLVNGIRSDLSSIIIFKTYTSLVDIGIISHVKRGCYKVTDPFLKLYIKEL